MDQFKSKPTSRTGNTNTQFFFLIHYFCINYISTHLMTSIKPLNIFLVFLLFSISTHSAFSQNKESNNPYSGLPFKDRLFFGGDLGLSFGTVTYIRVAPIIGYNISPKFAVGGGPSYQYYKDNRYSGYETSIYGGSVFGRYFVLDRKSTRL